MLALSSALPAGAEAFTIPAGSTTSCKKNAAPVNAWWPNSGNSENIGTAKAVDMVAFGGQLWVLTVNGAVTKAASYTINVVNSTTFKKEKTASTTGVVDAKTSALVGLDRFGSGVLAIDCNSDYTKALHFYYWTGTGNPTVKSVDVSSAKFSNGRGFGSYGDINSGNVYVLAADKLKSHYSMYPKAHSPTRKPSHWPPLPGLIMHTSNRKAMDHFGLKMLAAAPTERTTMPMVR